MAIYIPDDKISEIRHAVDITEVVSESVSLRRAGKNFVGLCPFHSEKTPSFTVSPDKQIFYCFGCGAGGNIFSFLMKRDGTTFAEAVRTLARRCGIDLPEKPLSGHAKKRIGEQEIIYGINRLAADFYHHTLLRQETGKKAREYLERRGLSAETLETFQLGYAPPGWDRLIGSLTRNRYSLAQLEKAGLVVARKDGSGFYDRFRDRVIFPIYDEQSRVVAFGGRVIDDSTPKYLNSPETAVYAKRRVLYGYSQAKNACRSEKSVFIVEGYLDLIALHQHGILNSVATLGTALSPDHIRALARIADHLVLVYDSDEAGIRSAKRCIELFWAEHVDFRRGDVFREEAADTHILVLPDRHDPDSFVFQSGADEFRRFSEAEKKSIVSFLMDAAVRTHGLTTEGKIRIMSEMQAPLTAINDSVARALYVQKLSERIGVAETVVLERIKEHSTAPAGRRPDQPKTESRAVTTAEEPTERLEQRIISMMLQFPAVIPEIIRRKILGFFVHDDLKACGEAIVAFRLQSCQQLPELLDQLQDERVKRRIALLAVGEDVWSPKGCRNLLAHFVRIRQKQGAGFLIQKAIEAAERDQNEPEVLRLLSEKQKMAVQREQQKMSVLREK